VGGYDEERTECEIAASRVAKFRNGAQIGKAKDKSADQGKREIDSGADGAGDWKIGGQIGKTPYRGIPDRH